MSPNVAKSKEKSSNSKEIDKLISFKKKILNYQKFIKKNFNYVGKNFAYEARSLHYSKKKIIEIFMVKQPMMRSKI